MKINELAVVPELLELTIDDPDIITKYGEPITFWTHSIVTLSTYFEFFDARQNDHHGQLVGIMKKLVLLEDGKPALGEGEELPVDISIHAINLIAEQLGKSQAKPSTQTVGEQVT